MLRSYKRTSPIVRHKVSPVRPTRNSRGQFTPSPAKKPNVSRTRRGSPRTVGRQWSPACAKNVPKRKGAVTTVNKKRKNQFYGGDPGSSSSDDSDGSSSDSDSDLSNCGDSSAAVVTLQAKLTEETRLLNEQKALVAGNAATLLSSQDATAAVVAEQALKLNRAEKLTKVLSDAVRLSLLKGVDVANGRDTTTRPVFEDAVKAGTAERAFGATTNADIDALLNVYNFYAEHKDFGDATDMTTVDVIAPLLT